MGVESATVEATQRQMLAFAEAIRTWKDGPTVTDIEGLEEPAPAPIDTSWMREENWDLGRLAPAA